MNEWGIPDWCDPGAYGDATRWDRDRWRWEFLRRRDDVREAFDAFADGTSDFVMHPLAIEIGLPQIPNPRIGDHGTLPWRNGRDHIAAHHTAQPPEKHVRVDFDLTRPIAPQLATAKAKLKALQGRTIQRREHPGKWLAYLRVLDGRAAGASWFELGPALPEGVYDSPQAARDVWQAADALRFNF